MEMTREKISKLCRQAFFSGDVKHLNVVKQEEEEEKLGKTAIVEIISDISTRQHNFSSVSDTYALQLKLNNASRFYLIRYNLNSSHPLKKSCWFHTIKLLYINLYENNIY